MPPTGESKSSVSRWFVTGTAKTLDELINRDLSGSKAAVLMIDGVDSRGRFVSSR